MIRKLQNKFILISMLSMLLVLAVVIGSINIINYRQVIQDADHVLRILSENNGEFPRKHPRSETKRQETEEQDTPPSSKSEREDAPPSPKSTEPESGNSAPVPQNPRPDEPDLSPEMPYETRYFSVLFAKDGTISSINIDKVAAIDEEKASAYATQILNTNSTSGFLSSYRYQKEAVSDGTRIIFVDCKRNLSTFRSFLLTSILVSFLGLLSVFILVVFFSRLVMKPVSESYEKQRQFITDAGHEIKTPLTIIDANREILEMEYGENEWSRSIGKQTKRLADLTNSLVYLSRMEEAEKHLQNIDFSISDMAAEAITSFQALADTQGKHFTTRIAPALSYHGDEASIHRLFSILLDNAIKYSPPQGSIEVTLDKRGKNIRFTVSNTTEEIPQGSLPHLFERFYRTDQSRNSETGGHGIGLSIARAITEAHKGKISAESRDGHSLLITVIL